jgi:hypothetical protein
MEEIRLNAEVGQASCFGYAGISGFFDMISHDLLVEGFPELFARLIIV